MFTLKPFSNSQCSTRIRSCYCCYRQGCRRLSCSLPIEELLGWILICSLIFWLYHIIKLCLTIALMIFVIYWIYQYVPIRFLLGKLGEKINQCDQSLIQMIQSIVQRVLSKRKTVISESIEEETTVDRTKKISSSNVINHSSTTSHLSSSNNQKEDHHRLEGTTIKNESYPTRKKSSITKNRFIESHSNIDENSSQLQNQLLNYGSSTSQSGFHGPIHTVKSETDNLAWFSRRPRSSMDLLTGFVQPKRNISSTSKISYEMPRVDDPTIADVLEQTKDIRQTINNLHKDISRLRNHLENDKVDQHCQLSDEDREMLKLVADYVIEKVKSSSLDEKATVTKQQESLRSKSMILAQPHEESIKLEYNAISSVDPDAKTLPLSTSHSPKCLPVQPSIVANSNIPRVPSKATVVAINDDDDHDISSYDDDRLTNQHIVISADQFENIPSRKTGEFQNNSIKESPAYKSDRINWIDYVPKRDPFPNAIQSDLPILHIDGQTSFFKQSLLSHFHRRPKLVNNHHVTESSSLNRTKSLHQLEKKNPNSIDRYKLIKQTSLHHMKHERVFRVRKSRILVSFDDLQRAIEVDHPSEPRINTIRHDNLVNNNQNQRNRSIMSLVRAFDSVIRQGELSIENDENNIICISSFDSTTDEYLLSIDSQSLFSVVSE